MWIIYSHVVVFSLCRSLSFYLAVFLLSPWFSFSAAVALPHMISSRIHFSTHQFSDAVFSLFLSISFDFIVAFYSSIEIYQCQMEPSNFTKSHSIIQQSEWATVEKNWTGCFVCLRWKSMPPPTISSFDHSSHDSLRILCLDFKFIHFARYFFLLSVWFDWVALEASSWMMYEMKHKTKQSHIKIQTKQNNERKMKHSIFCKVKHARRESLNGWNYARFT